MKPLLVIPPAPLRIPPLEALLESLPPARLADLRARFAERMDGANDALAAIPSGGQMLASACIRRRSEIGVLGDMFTRVDHRKQGMARSLLQTLLSWFDMTGGQWLYLTCQSGLAADFFVNFGFEVLHRTGREATDTVVLLRRLAQTSASPFETDEGPIEIRQAGPADFAPLFALAQHRRGPDPRVPLAESALSADATVVELLDQAQRGQCVLLAALRGGRIVGVSSIATAQLGKRSYAVIAPCVDGCVELRAATVEFGNQRGYETVDFPMEILGTALESAASPARG